MDLSKSFAREDEAPNAFNAAATMTLGESGSAASHWSMKRQSEMTCRPKIAVSACLLGQRVRFDGGHKQSHLVKDLLAEYCDLLPICPEVGIGLGTPREPIRLVKMANQSIRVRGSRNPELDVTDALEGYAQRMGAALQDVSGYIFMQKSPSCGLFRVKLYDEAGHGLYDKTTGAYAQAVVQQFPLMPAEEAGRLCDAVIFENFVTRVFTDHEWRQLLADGVTHARIQAFHSRHKLLLMAHSPASCRELGALVATGGGCEPVALADAYRALLMQTLARRASRKSHSYVLGYMGRFLKHWLSQPLKREWQSLVDFYRKGTVPLIVPMTLVRHYAEQHPQSFLAQQVYLQPHPLRLGLRNSI